MNDQVAVLLAQLKDVQAPPVSVVPALGWWIVAIGMVALMVVLYRVWQRFVARQWQREARTELARLRTRSEEVSVQETLASTSRLARQVLLVAAPRDEVASLYGKEWLEALDSVSGQSLFTAGFGGLLESGPYQRNPSVGGSDLEALFDAMELLIQRAAPTSVKDIQ